MADVSIVIFTFTYNEATAVRSFLQSLIDDARPTVWTAMLLGETITATLSDGRSVQIQHKPLSAQGNTVAAAALGRAVTESGDADYFFFYGCCGAIDGDLIGQAFRVATVSYISLGKVYKSATGDEAVRLKNKWIVRTEPSDQAPLPTIVLPAGGKGAPGSLTGLDVPDAHALATDKVVHIAVASEAPNPIRVDNLGPVYAKGEWTYAQALKQYADAAMGPVLVDMESFGIASAMRSLGLDERVIVLRVVTDALSDKEGQGDDDQLALLMGGLPTLAATLATIIGVSDDAAEID